MKFFVIFLLLRFHKIFFPSSSGSGLPLHSGLLEENVVVDDVCVELAKDGPGVDVGKLFCLCNNLSYSVRPQGCFN
jgi:hypothetical protein